MRIGGRMLKRLNSIERNYGDVVLAATMFSLAIAVHGAFAVASLQKHAEPADSANIQLDPGAAPLDFGDVNHPIPTFGTHHEISFASVPEQPAASTTMSVVSTAPAESVPVGRQNIPAQLKPAASIRSHDTPAKTVTTDQPGKIAEEPPISAVAANQGSQGISALSDTTFNDQQRSAVSTSPAISAVSR